MSEKNPVSKRRSSSRVYRGGGWGTDAEFATVTYHFGNHPDNRYGNRGFRLARTVKK
jgi:formylglycine-generating enzyme required for sulfatase activity